MKYVLIVLTFTACFFSPNAAPASERDTITTQDFEIALPAKWHLDDDCFGGTYGNIDRDDKPHFALFFKPTSKNNEAKASDRFEQEFNVGLNDFIDSDEMKKILAESKWHQSETILHLNWIREEMLDLRKKLLTTTPQNINAVSYGSFRTRMVN